MNKKMAAWIAAGLFLGMQGSALAMSCEVDFRAKRMVEENRWFGSVKRPEFKSGTVTGEGETAKACQQDALAEIKRDGWEVTYQRFRKKD